MIPDAEFAQLQERVAQLEQHGGPEALQPNILFVNADGTIGAQLTGNLKAAGIDLTASGGPAALIRWWNDRAKEQTEYARVYADKGSAGADGNSGSGLLGLEALAPTGARAELDIEAAHQGLGPEHLLAVFTLTALDGNGNSASRTLLDSLGQSRFLQLATTQRLQLNAGRTTVNKVAGATTYGVTVNHGLKDEAGANLAPLIALAGGHHRTGFYDSYTEIDPAQFTATTFRIDCFCTGGPANGGNADICWLAIG